MNRLFLLALLLLAALPARATRTLVDETGQTVLVPDHPHRVISLVPSITEDAFELGAADDIVAVSDYTRYPEAATKKPRVGSILQPSFEAIVALHPDLLLAQPAQTGTAAIEQFRRLGIPIYLVKTTGIAGILHSLTSLGQVLNRQPEAAALVARLQARIDAVRDAVRGKPVIPVFMPITYDPVITIGKGAFITEIIAIAGGRSITDDLPQEWPRIGMETVLARAPQALVLIRDGRVTPATLKTRPGWDQLPAVRNGRIFYFDPRINLPSPVAIDALEDLAHQFHP